MLMVLAAAISGIAWAAPPYVIVNDDQSFPSTGVSFFAVSPNGGLTRAGQVATVGTGIGGGFFGANRIKVLSTANQACVFASEAGTGDVVGININTLTVGGSAAGSQSDTGAGNGIGLALNDQYLYAGFSDSNTIGTFKILSGCGLMFVNGNAVAGVENGFINGMAVRGDVLVVTYTDGTIESFDIGTGPPISRGDKQLSTETVRSKGATFPNSVDITSDGRFAIFGDTSTACVVETSEISSGKLAKTRVYRSSESISSSTVMLSPDESLLYVVNTQGDSVSALFFNKVRGTLAAGCTSDPIRGHSSNWSYLAGIALQQSTGNGGGMYVAEFPTGIARMNLKVKGTTCSWHEAVHSPTEDRLAAGLLSIGSYPPRSF
jgi:hypothetical protein